MKRTLFVVFLAAATLLTGCIVVPERGYYRHYDRDYQYHYGSGYR